MPKFILETAGCRKETSEFTFETLVEALKYQRKSGIKFAKIYMCDYERMNGFMATCVDKDDNKNRVCIYATTLTDLQDKLQSRLDEEKYDIFIRGNVWSNSISKIYNTIRSRM